MSLYGDIPCHAASRDPIAAFWSGLFFTNLRVLPKCDVSLVFLSQARPDQRRPLAKRIAATVEDFFGETCR